VQGATITIELEDQNSMLADQVVSRQPLTGATDVDGACYIDMIQFGEFIRGGIYRVQIADPDGRLISHRRVKVPNVSTAKATELIDV
jgi:hypothetical protein